MKNSSMCAKETSDIEQRVGECLKRDDDCVAVACSGGGDSMALALAATSHAQKCGTKIIVLTVDHGLRRESAKEVKQVGLWLKKCGIPHAILKWEGKKPKSNVQEAAREARYALLADYCRKHGIKKLLVAHTQDDQAETFLLRLKRGSGVDGLSAMSAVSEMNGITIVRPLLEVPKSDLLAYLKLKKQDYIQDPSNENTAYDRIKIRKLMPKLAEVGLSPERLAKTAHNMARARRHLQQEAEYFLQRNCMLFAEGYAVLKSLPDSEEIALRVLARLLMVIGGHAVTPRLTELDHLHDALKSGEFKGATLGGCIFKVASSKLQVAGILIFREPFAVGKSASVKSHGKTAWDRFEITCNLQPATRNFSVSALTQQGWLTVAKQNKLISPYPDKRILYTLPAIRDAKGRVVAVPHLGVGNETFRALFTGIRR